MAFWQTARSLVTPATPFINSKDISYDKIP